MESGSGAKLPDERVRSAAHALTRTRPRLTPVQIIGVIIGVGAAAAAITFGAFALLHNPPPTRTFPAGPTADKITVSVARLPADTPKSVVTRP